MNSNRLSSRSSTKPHVRRNEDLCDPLPPLLPPLLNPRPASNISVSSRHRMEYLKLHGRVFTCWLRVRIQYRLGLVAHQRARLLHILPRDRSCNRPPAMSRLCDLVRWRSWALRMYFGRTAFLPDVGWCWALCGG